MTMTLMIIEGEHYYSTGSTIVVGDNWIKGDNLRMQICCNCFSIISIYKKITFEDFAFCISRLRSRERIIQSRGNLRTGVVMNLEGMWFGKEQILCWDNWGVNLKELRVKYEKYWEGKQ